MKGGCDQWLTYWLLRNSGALQYHFSFIKQKSCTINHPIREASNVMVGIYFRSVKLALPAFSVVGVVLSARYLPSSTSSRTPSLQLWNREQCSWGVLQTGNGNRSWGELQTGNGNSSWGVLLTGTGNSSWGGLQTGTGNSSWGGLQTGNGNSSWGVLRSGTGTRRVAVCIRKRERRLWNC